MNVLASSKLSTTFPDSRKFIVFFIQMSIQGKFRCGCVACFLKPLTLFQMKISGFPHPIQPGFFFGMDPNTVFRISVTVIWESTHTPGDESSSPGESGYFPKLPKRVCITQQGLDFGTLSFTAKLSLSCWVSSR